MTEVQTVSGPIRSDSLGITLMHEHVFVLTTDVQQNYPDEWGSESARQEQAVQSLQQAYDVGVRTIVDLTVTGLGRYIPRIQNVAQRVPVNLVVATGLYTYNDVPFFFHHRGPATAAGPDPMVELFVSDIVDGIAGTGVKAGVLKCAIDEPGLTPGVERVMRAVAQAQLATGVPVTVHTHPASRTGSAVHRVMCEEEGVDPTRIVLGHSGDATDIDHLAELADLGFVLGMDRFGLGAAEERFQTLLAMLSRGYAAQMVLSHDAACYIDWMAPALLEHFPQWNYTHLLHDVVPRMLARGVTQQQVEMMLVEVPRRVLAGTGP
jgi:phosphotriesterase-related protein